VRAWDLLASAGVREMGLHGARHTAATALLFLGVPERAVMGVTGCSNITVGARYQHVTALVRTDSADRVGTLLREATETPADTQDQTAGP
jgi:integrase